MDQITAWLKAFAAAHPSIWLFVIVPLVTIVANPLIKWMTTGGWDALLAKYPRVAAVFKVLKAFGLDPVTGIVWLVVVITGNPPAAYLAKYGLKPKPKTPTLPAFIMGASLVLVVAWFGVMSCTPARTAAAEKMGVDTAVCAINAYEKNPAITPEQLAVECVGIVVEDGLKVIVAHKKGKTLAAPPPCGSSSK